MADALCGPSNALQNFQKHTSVDRTLQQDRLVGRHSPAQGFRSTGANAGALDPEFEAFQAGLAGPSQLQPDFHHLPPHLANAPQPPPHFAQGPTAPDWASDFQRLNITNEHALGVQQHRMPAGAATWHQDFLMQQAPVVHAPPHQQHNGFGSMSSYGTGRFGGSSFQQPMGFGGINGGVAAQAAYGEYRTQASALQLDEAFEQAFAQMDQDVEEVMAQNGQTSETPSAMDERTRSRDYTSEQHAVLESTQAHERSNYELQLQALERQNLIRLRMAQEEARVEAREPNALEHMEELQRDIARTKRGLETLEDGDLLRQIRERRPAVYATLKFRAAADINDGEVASILLNALEKMEEKDLLVADPTEARWIVQNLQSILRDESRRDRLHEDFQTRMNSQQELQKRAETLIRSINERLMSTYPLLSSMTMSLNQENIWEELQAAGFTGGIVRERMQQKHQQNEQLRQLHQRQYQEELQQQQPEPQQTDVQPLHTDDDEMATTAGLLLERVADNTSEKFQNSQFLQLMRKLRDREVKVEGDKMVEVNSITITSTPRTTASEEARKALLRTGVDLDSDPYPGFVSPITGERLGEDERIPVTEQDLDLGRDGIHGFGLKRNGLRVPIEEVLHHR